MLTVSKKMQAVVVSMGVLAAGVAGAAGDTKSKTNQVKDKAAAVKKEATQDVKEAMLHSKIRLALLKSLKGADALRVNVDVRGTTAVLSGEIEDRASEQIASEATKAVDGVTSVTSTITHNPKAPKQENMESRIKDAMLGTQVKMVLLQDVGPTAMGITVTATDGAVSLRGDLPTEAAHTSAVQKVKAMQDVKRVEDLISVKQ